MAVPQMPIVGATVQLLSFDFAFSISFDDTARVRIESQFSVSSADGRLAVFDPEKDLHRMGSLLTLHQTTVTFAEADDAGDLQLHFSDGRRLRCAPDADFEAWEFSSSSGMRLIALPGGGLAIWDALPD